MSVNNRLFCAKPFKWFEVSGWSAPKGDVYLCCPTWLDTPIGNLQEQSVDEIWNGQVAQDIRRSILDGSFTYCNESRCPFLQTISGPVQRGEDVTDTDLREAIAHDLTALPYGPREINCSYDKSCNLSCPSCRTEVIVERNHAEEILTIQGKLQHEALKDGRLLYITGSGDPFGSPFFKTWLQSMKRDEMPELQSIHLHTNALLWTPKQWSSIPVDIQALITSAEISIDAASAATYSLNRRGGSFLRLLENLEFISGLRKAGPLQSVTISMVVQENNFAEMPDFVRLGTRYGFDTVYFSQLVNWGTYSAAEFRSRAIHVRTHPHYSDFLEVLKDSLLQNPCVHLGNLTDTEGQNPPAVPVAFFSKKMIAKLHSRLQRYV
jgi:MoaA/NifB/PqqE/SkfB family radical SAM enzyme